MRRLMPISGDPEPKKVYQTQAQVDAANAEARRFSKAHNTMFASDAYVAQKPGDPVVQYNDINTGKPYDGRYSQLPPSMIKGFVPDWVNKLEFDHDTRQPYYLDGNDMVFVDKKFYNDPRFTMPQKQQDQIIAMRNGLMPLK